jgi:transposase
VCRLEKELEQLQEKLNKLSQRSSENSSLPPSSDGYKKKSKGFESKVKKKRGPKHGHEGTTRNGFERIDNQIELTLENCPVCEPPLERVESAPVADRVVGKPASRGQRISATALPMP